MNLPIEISFRDMDSSEAVEARVRERVEKLQRYFDRALSCRVVVEARHRSSRKGKLYNVRLHLSIPGKDVVVGHEQDQLHDHLRGQVIQELMCYDGLSFDTFDDALGIGFTDYFSAELERLEPMIADGLVLRDDRSIKVTERGRLLVRSVAMAFDRYLNDTAPERFSKAI